MSPLELRPLGLVAERVTVGHVGSTSQYYRDHGVLFLRTQNVGTGSLDLTDVKYVTAEFNARLKKSQVRPGDVLLSRVITNTVRVAVVPRGFAEANCANVVLVRPGPAIDPAYLAYFIASPEAQRQLLRGKVGSAQTVVNTTVVKNWKLPLPPLAEQKRIAGILDAADALRAKRRESLAQLDTLLQSTFLDMFGDPVTNPMGWEVRPLGLECDLLTGFAFRSGDFLPGGEGLALLRGINVGVGKVSWNNRADWTMDSEPELERFRLSAGDIVLAMDRPWISGGLKVAVVGAEDLPSLLVQRVCRVRSPDSETRSLVYLLINSQAFERHCNPTETTIPHISPRDVREFPVIQPPSELRGRFAKVSALIDRKRLSQEAHLAELDTLFASLQSRAFRGDL